MIGNLFKGNTKSMNKGYIRHTGHKDQQLGQTKTESQNVLTIVIRVSFKVNVQEKYKIK